MQGTLEKPIRLTIVSYDPFIANGLANGLQAKEGISVLSTLSTEEPFIQSLIEEINVLIIHPRRLDSSVFEELDVLELTRPEIKKILLLPSDDLHQCLQAIKIKTQGALIYNTMTLGELLYAVHDVYDGKKFIAPCIIQNMHDALMRFEQAGALPSLSGASSSALTARESEIVLCLVEGLSNREIAKQKCVQIKTIKNHLTSIYSKLQVQSRSEAIAMLL